MSTLLTTAVDNIIATTIPVYLPVVVDNIFKEIPLFNKINEGGNKEYLDGGYEIHGIVEYAKNSTFAARKKSEEITVTDEQILEKLQYRWGTYNGSVTIYDNDKSMNSGTQAIVSLVKSKMQNLKKTAQDSINTDLYLAVDTDPKILPLGLLIGTTNTTGVIGGINRTNTWWRQNVISSAGSFASNGRKYMDQMVDNCSKGQNFDTPNLIISDKTTHQYYKLHLQPRERYLIVSTGATGKPNLSYDEPLKFGRAEYVWDAASTSGRQYFINTDYMKLKIMKGREFRNLGPLRQPTKHADIYTVDIMFQLVCTCLARQGCIDAFTE